MRRELTGLVIGGLFVLGDMSTALAGPPMTNVEGVGGCALNPLAYVANPIGKDETGLFGSSVVSKPNVGAWHISLSESDINWEAAGFNLSFFNRLEIGYSHEWVDVDVLDESVDKNNFSAKVNLLPEGSFGMPYLPAVSVGVIHKDTNFNDLVVANHLDDDSGEDYYVVATKTLNILPLPVILSAGVLSTKGYVRGVLGFGEDRDEAFFCNIEAVLLENIIVGWEYAQGTDVDSEPVDYSTHSMWEAHVCWMLSDFSLILSYADTGNENLYSNPTASAFGKGWVISAQYAF